MTRSHGPPAAGARVRTSITACLRAACCIDCLAAWHGHIAAAGRRSRSRRRSGLMRWPACACWRSRSCGAAACQAPLAALQKGCAACARRSRSASPPSWTHVAPSSARRWPPHASTLSASGSGAQVSSGGAPGRLPSGLSPEAVRSPLSIELQPPSAPPSSAPWRRSPPWHQRRHAYLRASSATPLNATVKAERRRQPYGRPRGEPQPERCARDSCPQAGRASARADVS